MIKKAAAPLPEALERIKAQAAQFQKMGAAASPDWKKSLDQAGLSQIVDIHILAGGEVVYLHQLSQGCQACKSGGWDCIFINHVCNLDCPFCYSPQAISPAYSGSVFGLTPHEVLANYEKTAIGGVSFSGGEPFLEAHSLLEWVTAIRAASPKRYLWVYTNGLLVTETLLKKLADAGLDEIRFNMAATGYRHKPVLSILETAARLVPYVTVEIPAIPEQAGELLGSLKMWNNCGVAYLNLHELIFEPGTNSATMDGKKAELITPDHHRSQYHPLSRALAWEVIKKVSAEKINLAVNDCSLQGKLRQLRKRRSTLIPLVKTAYEKQVGDDVLQAGCIVDAFGEVHYISPDSLDQAMQFFPDHRFFIFSRIVPLSLQNQGQWISFEEIQPQVKG